MGKKLIPNEPDTDGRKEGQTPNNFLPFPECDVSYLLALHNYADSLTHIREVKSGTQFSYDARTDSPLPAQRVSSIVLPRLDAESSGKVTPVLVKSKTTRQLTDQDRQNGLERISQDIVMIDNRFYYQQLKLLFHSPGFDYHTLLKMTAALGVDDKLNSKLTARITPPYMPKYLPQGVKNYQLNITPHGTFPDSRFGPQLQFHDIELRRMGMLDTPILEFIDNTAVATVHFSDIAPYTIVFDPRIVEGYESIMFPSASKEDTFRFITRSDIQVTPSTTLNSP